MKPLITVILNCLLLCFIISCATPYQREGLRGGYSERLTSPPDTYEVYFSGNGFTSHEQAHDFALLRASELTLFREFKYFTVLEDIASEAVLGTMSINEGWKPSEPRLTKPGCAITFKCLAEKTDSDNTFDAEELKQSILEKYGMN